MDDLLRGLLYLVVALVVGWAPFALIVYAGVATRRLNGEEHERVRTLIIWLILGTWLLLIALVYAWFGDPFGF